MAREVKVYMGNLKKKGSKFSLKKTVAAFGLATGIMCTLVGCGSDNDFTLSKPIKNQTSYESSNQATNNSNQSNDNTVYNSKAFEEEGSKNKGPDIVLICENPRR